MVGIVQIYYSTNELQYKCTNDTNVLLIEQMYYSTHVPTNHYHRLALVLMYYLY